MDLIDKDCFKTLDELINNDVINKREFYIPWEDYLKDLPYVITLIKFEENLLLFNNNGEKANLLSLKANHIEYEKVVYKYGDGNIYIQLRLVFMY